jgi:hypothetical protein
MLTSGSANAPLSSVDPDGPQPTPPGPQWSWGRLHLHSRLCRHAPARDAQRASLHFRARRGCGRLGDYSAGWDAYDHNFLSCYIGLNTKVK